MLSISIVTYHTDDDELRRCLDSIPRDGVDCIYVVDNSRSKSTEDLCRQSGRVSYIASDNVGYGAAHNIALRQSMAGGTDYHLVLNPDITFNPSELKLLTDYMDSHPNVGAVQPKIVNPDGTLQMSVRMIPTPMDLIVRRFLPRSWFKKRRARYLLQHLDHDKPFDAPYHQGSFMLLRVAALRDVGIFDERFFMYPEDIDLSRRIHRKYPTMYVPLMTVVHDHRAASYHSVKMLRIHMVNMIRYFNKWGWIFDAERKAVNKEIDKR